MADKTDNNSGGLSAIGFLWRLAETRVDVGNYLGFPGWLCHRVGRWCLVVTRVAPTHRAA